MADLSELKNQILFEDIDAGGIEKIASTVKELSLKKGEHLFKEGEDTKGIYLIKSGKIEISKVTADGWKQTLALFLDGHFFGELSLLEKRSHEANATALENTVLFLMTKEDFERMQSENPSLAFQIIKKIALVMSKNLRRMNEKFLNALINY